MSLPGILRLPTEILVSIFEFQDLQDCGSVPNIRLTCQRFCALSSHLLIRKVYVDITQQETIDRLQSIVADAGLAKGVREVYLRVHFYHPWVAASFEKFTASIESEWKQRTSSRNYYEQDQQQGSVWDFERIAWNFIRSLDRTVAGDASHHEMERQSTGNDADTRTSCIIRPSLVLQRAYKLYKAGYESQDGIMRNRSFTSVLSKTLFKFKDLSRVIIYDRELNNNYDPGMTICVPREDCTGQTDALVSVFSRPMVWEDAQWIEPSEEIRAGVPIQLLVEIPIAIGQTHGLMISNLHIQVTAAPDYARLPTDPETLGILSAAIKQMELFQFSFKPCCASGCGPWRASDDWGEIRGANGKSATELQALGEYLGAILDCDSIKHAEINLGEFWMGAGFDSIDRVPTSLGTSWFHASAGIRSLDLRQVPLTTADLERFITEALADEEVEISLLDVYLWNGTWKQILESPRMAKRKNMKIRLKDPLGGGLGELDQEAYSLVFDQLTDHASMAEQYIRGEIDRNPLE
ncbi:hypothetical protein TMatcc_010374 [Talaromyces marneffei ATCC 18224]